MNAKERKRAKLMYRFPLLLALTGLVLLLLHWVLGFSSMDAFGELLPLVRRNWYILVLPVVLPLPCPGRGGVWRRGRRRGAVPDSAGGLVPASPQRRRCRGAGSLDSGARAVFQPAGPRRAGVSGEHFGFCRGSCPGAMQRLNDLLLYGLCQRAAPGDRAGHPTAGPARRRKRFFPGRLTQAQGRAILIAFQSVYFYRIQRIEVLFYVRRAKAADHSGDRAWQAGHDGTSDRQSQSGSL